MASVQHFHSDSLTAHGTSDLLVPHLAIALVVLLVLLARRRLRAGRPVVGFAARRAPAHRRPADRRRVEFVPARAEQPRLEVLQRRLPLEELRKRALLVLSPEVAEPVELLQVLFQLQAQALNGPCEQS